MASSIVNGDANLKAAQTTFITEANSIFSGGVPGVWDQFTTKVSASGTSVDLLITDGVPQVREWQGSKQFKQLRSYKLTKAIRPWEASLTLKIDEINGDMSGVVSQRLADLARSTSTIYDKIMVAELITNPTCYDGVSLLSNSHVNVTTGTTDNLTTSALSFAEYKTARDAIRSMTNEVGEPMGLLPTHILVGPAQERIGMEVTGSDRPVAISADGTQDEGANGVAAVTLTNYIGGDITLMVSDRITGNEWFCMDLSKGGAKPMFLAEFQAPTAVTLDQPTDANVFNNDEALFSITAKATPMAGNWRTIYGSVSA